MNPSILKLFNSVLSSIFYKKLENKSEAKIPIKKPKYISFSFSAFKYNKALDKKPDKRILKTIRIKKDFE